MSGDLFMMKLWKYVDAKNLDKKSKANIFLIMNIILWSGIAFLLSLFVGVFCGYSAEWVEWTVPKWTVPGDIVLFFHAKTAIQSIRRLETALKKEKEHLSQREYERLWKALQRARLLYQKYGGKILAIGKVAEQPFYDAHPGMSEEEQQTLLRLLDLASANLRTTRETEVSHP